MALVTSVHQPSIQDLAVIGDQQSCACIDKEGTIAWYCLWRFDQPSLFSLLIDANGGWWRICAAGKTFCQRSYKKNTAVLETEFSVEGGSFTVTDFMPTGVHFTGICRRLSPSPVPVSIVIFFTPDYNRSSTNLKKDNTNGAVYDSRFEFYLKASHPLTVNGSVVEMKIPPGEEAWCLLLDHAGALNHLKHESVLLAQQQTEKAWNNILGNLSYTGPYQEQMRNSYRAIQLMRHAKNGGILAAATTSLPEVIGSHRNYDYRYVWLRDTAMNVSALLRSGSKGNEAEKFLDFLCAGRATNKENLFVPFYDLDYKAAPYEENIPGTGYRLSKPLRIGNNANEQMQLDAQGNIIIAAKEIYESRGDKPHWKTIVQTADYLVEHWQEKDQGIWEEHRKEHFTSSKVLVTKSLEFLSHYADTEEQKNRWLHTAKKIRAFIEKYCLTSDGAYAVYAGSENVDVTAALYAVWLYQTPHSTAMQKTIGRLEEEYKEGELYHRHLLNDNWRKEGVFLAGSLWMAQYYLMINDLKKAESIIEAVLKFSTDLGFLPEEGDVNTGEALGNFPQTFVHASLMGCIVDLKKAQEL